MDIFTSTASHPHIVARVDARRDLTDGQMAKLHLDTRRIHVFEPGETGPNISLRSAQAVSA
ncbi:MAG TPA: hypothetical protein DCX07_01325 [Phycisphaerales bacterium]|nr:hypothetical protein [Phycisphaerales bacterium]